MRAAIYFTPPAGAPLTRTATEWLGRNAFDGEPTREQDPAIDPLVASPARYGFHATIKAPFRLAAGFDLSELDARLAAFCASRESVLIDGLEISRLGPFFALTPETTPQALFDLEASVVTEFEPFRATASADEIARRSPETLEPRQRENLARWGYPYVFQDFRFHMTLTGPVSETERASTYETLVERFAEFEGGPLVIDALALFIESEPGAPFKVHSLHSFHAP